MPRRAATVPILREKPRKLSRRPAPRTPEPMDRRSRARLRTATAAQSAKSATEPATTAASAAAFPSAAAAGHQTREASFGAAARSAGEVSTAMRSSPEPPRMAMTWRLITKPAPTIAATICATSRARAGPSAPSSSVATTSASAVATSPRQSSVG